MSMMEWVADPVGHVKKYTNLARICFQDVGRFDDCDQVWAIIGIALGIVCLLVLGFVARHFLREHAAYRRFHAKRLAELEVAPPDIMNEYVWAGDSALETGLSQNEMIQRIKDAKAKQRLDEENKTGSPTLGLGSHER